MRNREEGEEFKLLKIFCLSFFLTCCFTGLMAQKNVSFESFVKKNSWYISITIPEKISDPKNEYGTIDFKPQRFEDIPFQLSDSLFQFFRINDTYEVLVLKPRDLLEEEFKKIDQ